MRGRRTTLKAVPPSAPPPPTSTAGGDELDEIIPPSEGEGPRRPSPAAGGASGPLVAPKREEFVVDAVNELVALRAATYLRGAQKAALVRNLPADFFMVKEHAAMWRSHRRMAERGMDYDPHVMRRMLSDEGVVVNENYLRNLEEEAGVPDNLDWYLSTLRWDSTRARLLQGPLRELLEAVKSNNMPAEKVAGIARGVLHAVEHGQGPRHIHRPEELNREYKVELEARRAVGNYWPYGYEVVDNRIVEGAMPTLTAVLVGLPGSGKSAMAADMAIKFANQKRRPLVCAWEMGAKRTIDTMVAMMTWIPIRKIIQGNLQPEEMERVNRAVDWITASISFMKNPFYDRDTTASEKERFKRWRKTNDDSLDIIEGYLAEVSGTCNVVIYDLYEKALPDKSNEAVAAALDRQQNMHKTYNMFGLLLHQLRLKEVEKRANPRPTRDAIKGTGAWVEFADQIWATHRDGHVRPGIPDVSLDLLCFKQKMGETNFATRFDWRGECYLITGGREIPFESELESGGEREFRNIDEVKGPRRPRGKRREEQ